MDDIIVHIFSTISIIEIKFDIEFFNEKLPKRII